MYAVLDKSYGTVCDEYLVSVIHNNKKAIWVLSNDKILSLEQTNNL